MREHECLSLAPKLRLDVAALLGVTPSCNMRCSWCHADFFTLTRPFQVNRTKSLAEAVATVMDAVNFPPHSVPRLYLSGRADPLIVPNAMLESAIRGLRNLCERATLVLVTNGLEVQKRAAGLRRSGVSRLNISTRGEPVGGNTTAAVRAAKKVGFQVHVNAPLTAGVRAQLDRLVRFSHTETVTVKLYSLLGTSHTDQQQTIEATLESIEQILGVEPRHDPVLRRMVFEYGDSGRVEVKLLSNDALRPEACRRCPKIHVCAEGCWNSIRITPWYVKPCGVREDNVYFFSEESLPTLRAKLSSCGKAGHEDFEGGHS